MRPGTAGFVGSRLTQARQVRQLTGVALAEMIGVKPAAISQYENEVRSPSPETFDRLVACLGFPATYFLTPLAHLERSPIFYRSMSSATKGARVRAEHRFTWLREISNYLEAEGVMLPELDLPTVDLPRDWRLLSMDDIELIAAEVRSHFRLPRGPIADTVAVLEHHGVVVTRDRLGADTLDSLSERIADRAFISIGTDRGTAVRWRFDASHELGHLILHCDVGMQSVYSSSEHKLLEAQAHRFAAAFLLPLESFGEDLTTTTLDGLRALKPRWKTSIAMMIRRLLDTELIGESTYQGLLINHARRGWKRHEPYDDQLPAEEPTMLRSAMTMLCEHGRLPAQIVADLNLPANDIEVIAGLPHGALSEGRLGVPLVRRTGEPPLRIVRE